MSCKYLCCILSSIIQLSSYNMNNLDLFLNEIQNIESQINPFNYALYYELYPDLKQQRICTFMALYQHYIKYGKSQNRIANYSDFYNQFPGFDYNFYVNSNKELVNAIQIKYSSKIESISEPYKEHFAIVHYFLFGQFQNKLINPNSLLTVDLNPLNLPTKLSFLSGPQLGNATVANICYQEYLTSNVVTIEPITEDLIQEGNIGSVLFVNNTFPLNVSYSQNVRIFNGNLNIDNANIKHLEINTIDSDLNIRGNLNINGVINSNSIVNQNLTTHYNYTNSFVFQDTFSVLGNLEVSTDLSLNDYTQINFIGNYTIITDMIKIDTIQFNLIDLYTFTIEFNLIVDDISTETQTIFECENFKINLNLFNQIEINYNDNVISGITQIVPNVMYFITITNNKLFINGNIDINLNLNKIYTSKCILGKNILVNLLLNNLRISNVIRYTNSFTINTNFIIDKNTLLLSEIQNNLLIFTGYSKIFQVNNNGLVISKGYVTQLITNDANINSGNVCNLNTNLINAHQINSNNSNLRIINSNLINCSNLNVDYIKIKSNTISIEKVNITEANIITGNIETINTINQNTTTGNFEKIVTTSNLLIENNTISNVNNFNSNLIVLDTNVNINSNLIVSGDTELSGNVNISQVNSNLYVNNEIYNNYGYLYGSTLLLQWDYFDIPVNTIYNFGLCEPGNNTGYSGSQFSTGFAIQNNPIINNSARLILRCQDISYNYTGSIGPKTFGLTVCQLRYQGDTPCVSINGDINTTYKDITETFLCNTETTKGYFTVVSPFFKLINLDVPTLGLRVVTTGTNGTHLRLGPTYLQLK